MLDLATALGKAAASSGVKLSKRSYQPHLSLARRVSPEPPPALTQPLFRCHFDSFALYESTRGRDGVRYRAIASWPLR